MKVSEIFSKIASWFVKPKTETKSELINRPDIDLNDVEVETMPGEISERVRLAVNRNGEFLRWFHRMFNIDVLPVEDDCGYSLNGVPYSLDEFTLPSDFKLMDNVNVCDNGIAANYYPEKLTDSMEEVISTVVKEFDSDFVILKSIDFIMNPYKSGYCKAVIVTAFFEKGA